MNRADRTQFRRAGVEALPEAPLWVDRWWGKPALISLSILLLTLSYAPYHLFPLAWFGLAPWLIVVQRSSSQWKVFLWSWLGGFAFFLANMWWIWFVTEPGMFGLMAILAFQWAWAGLIIRGNGLMSGTRLLPLRVPAIAGIWVTTEWFRGSFPWNGLPWLYLGHTQTPALSMCQIADVTGVAGVSFWVVCLNVVIALLVIQRLNFRRCAGSLALVGVMSLGMLAYGWLRMAQPTQRPGPKVMVVQSNYPQSNSGAKGASQEEITRFHIETTRRALAVHPDVDLVVWSETMMPPLNKSARIRARAYSSGELWLAAHRAIMDLGNEFDTALLVGGRTLEDWDSDLRFHEERNTAFFYEAGGLVSDKQYDKIHLVPFGEFMPFKEGFPALYKFFMSFSPYGYDYTLKAGNTNQLTVFETKNVRFVTPICFEDIDAWLVARMFRSDEGKRADLIVNLTNDGWFKANEMPQHLQAAVFRSIENRAPTARSVNTGISGFIDSIGQVHDLVPEGVEGVSISQVSLDHRYTVFTRWGEWFSFVCAGWTSVLVVGSVIRWWKFTKAN